MRKETVWVIAAGGIIGVIALVLMALGNSANMGLCIACFERDIAGALGFFNWEDPPIAIRYLRPEIIGIVLGGLLTALAMREFKPKGGSAPVIRFMLGVLMMLGALVFLGCPLRMVLRLGGGDLNAVLALAGFVVGIAIGAHFLRRGFNLGHAKSQGKLDGLVLPAFMVLLLVLVIFLPQFIEGGPILESTKGHVGATGSVIDLRLLGLLISLAAGLLVGFLAQRTRFCFAGGIRDLMLFKSWHLISGIIILLAVVLIGNLAMGNFQLGFADQPASHTVHWLNLGGMVLVGLCAALLGGCPLRQLILSGNGNTDSALAVLGMIAGAALAHNFGLVKGAGIYGKVALFIGLAIAIIIAVVYSKKQQT